MLTPFEAGRGGAAAPTRLRLRFRLVWISVTLLAALIAARDFFRQELAAPEDIAPSRRIVSRQGASNPTPFFSQSWVNPSGHTLSSHCSVICALPSGDLLAVWYGGTREGAADVAVFTSRLSRNESVWTTPMIAVDRALAQNELDRSIKKVGNAVIFPDHCGNLWMIYVSVTVGGWSGCSLNLKISSDEGRSWGESRRLTLNPFFNLSSLVRNKPIYATDGRIGLPVYHEMGTKFPQMLWLTPAPLGGVRDYRMRNLSEKTGLIQPSLVPLDHDRVLMMLRDVGNERSLRTAFSDDNGWTWSETALSGLPNPDSAIDALRLRDGRILLAYNDGVRGRESLRLATSSDQGRTWIPGVVIEKSADCEYSYPYLVEDYRGRIHLTYTWHRQRIKHVQFNLAWLDGKPAALEVAAQ